MASGTEKSSSYGAAKDRRESRVLTIDEIVNPGGVLTLEQQHRKHQHQGEKQRPLSQFQQGDQAPQYAAITATRGQPIIRITHGRHAVFNPTMGAIPENAGHNVRGQMNPAFAGSQTTIGSTPSVQVVHEQYWSWSCACRNWTRRERYLVYVVAVLVLIIFGMVAVVSVFSRHREAPLTESWPWTF